MLRRISVSKVTQYYLTNFEELGRLENVLTRANSIIFENGKIYLTYSDKRNLQFIFDSLRLVLDKSSHITLENKYAYEYELDKKHEKDDTVFEMSTLYQTYRTELSNVYFVSWNKLEVVFKIIN